MVNAFANLGHIERVKLPEVTRLDTGGQSITSVSTDALVIRHGPKIARRVMMAIHLDTVFPKTIPSKTPMSKVIGCGGQALPMPRAGFA